MTAPEISLEDYLDGDLTDLNAEPNVASEGDATQLLRRIKNLRTRADQNSQLANDEVAKIRAWEGEVNGPILRQLDFFESLLKQYMRFVRDGSDGKVKSLNLPTGTIKTTAQQPKWAVDDVDAFARWALENNPDLIKLDYKPVGVAELKKTFVDNGEGEAVHKPTGDLVPGLTITKPEQPYSVTIKTN